MLLFVLEIKPRALGMLDEHVAPELPPKLLLPISIFTFNLRERRTKFPWLVLNSLYIVQARPEPF